MPRTAAAITVRIPLSQALFTITSLHGTHGSYGSGGTELCLVLYGTDVEATQRPFAVTELSVEQDSVRVAVPMAPVHTLRSDKGNQ